MCRSLLGGQHGGPGEAVGHDRVVQGDRDDLGDLVGGAADQVEVRLLVQVGAADADPAAEQPVPRQCLVVAQQVLAQPLRVRVRDAIADVVGDGAQVVDVVVQPLGLEQERADRPGSGIDLDAEGVLDGKDVGQGVAHGGVAADPLRQFDALRGRAPLEQLLDPAVQEPQPGLHLQDGLADHREPEVAGLDEARVDGSDRDLVDAVTLDRDERVGVGIGVEPGSGVGIAAHRVVAEWASGRGAPVGGAAGGRPG